MVKSGLLHELTPPGSQHALRLRFLFPLRGSYLLRAFLPSLFLMFPLFGSLLAAEPLVLRRETFSDIGFSGGAKGSYAGEGEDGRLSLFLVNGAGASGASARLMLAKPMDLSGYGRLRIRVRALKGAKAFWLAVEDGSGKQPESVQVRTGPIYIQGSDEEPVSVTVHLNELGDKYDPTRVISLILEFGTDTVDNPAGSALEISSMVFLPKAVAAAPGAVPVQPVPAGEWVKPALLPETARKPTAADAGKAAREGPVPFSLQQSSHYWFRVIAVIGAAWFMIWMLYREKPATDSSIAPLYEINARAWGASKLPDGACRLRKFKEIPAHELAAIRRQGFRSVWMMGIWEIPLEVRAISRRYADDYSGSPYAIADYRINPQLGTEVEFQDFVKRAHRAGLKVIVDFIPNHIGVGSPWIKEHPEWFIHRRLSAEEKHLPDDELCRRHPDYFPVVARLPNGDGYRDEERIVVAHGRDPYFPSWIDTAQLDYAVPRLRKKMVSVLEKCARLADGVRCDMAMLVLRSQVHQQWHRDWSQENFNRRMPHEFWEEAIPAIKKQFKDFVFIAESYWANEGYLQELGFDYTYNKHFYDLLKEAVHTGHAGNLVSFLKSVGKDFLRRSLNFIENHDEERAMVVFGPEKQRPAAIALATLPGLPLFHQGQLEGWSERLPVQRVIPKDGTPCDAELKNFYSGLISLIQAPVFRLGDLHWIDSDNASLLAFSRSHEGKRYYTVINFSGSNQTALIRLPQASQLFAAEKLYAFNDIHHRFRRRPKDDKDSPLLPYYVYPGQFLVRRGLPIELPPFEAHIFSVKIVGSINPGVAVGVGKFGTLALQKLAALSLFHF